MASSRVLTLTFELHVPEGLPSNIRAARIDTAVAAFKASFQALCSTHFPWADRLSVHSDWSYRWAETNEVIPLPATDDNTIVSSAADDVAEPPAAVSDGPAA